MNGMISLDKMGVDIHEKIELASEVSSNLLEGNAFLKMQDASLNVLLRNFDRMLVLNSKVNTPGASVPEREYLQLEYDVLRKHFVSVEDQEYKGTRLFGDGKSDLIRLYSYEFGNWLTVDVSQPDLNDPSIALIRNYGIYSSKESVLVDKSILMQAMKKILNYRLINNAQEKRIGNSLNCIRDEIGRLTRVDAESNSKIIQFSDVEVNRMIDTAELMVDKFAAPQRPLELAVM